MFHNQELIGGNDPFHPSFGGFCVIPAFCPCQIKPPVEIIPRLKGTGKISHGPPDADEITGFVSFGQISNLIKMGIGILPKPLNEAVPIPG